MGASQPGGCAVRASLSGIPIEVVRVFYLVQVVASPGGVILGVHAVKDAQPNIACNKRMAKPGVSPPRIPMPVLQGSTASAGALEGSTCRTAAVCMAPPKAPSMRRAPTQPREPLEPVRNAVKEVGEGVGSQEKALKHLVQWWAKRSVVSLLKAGGGVQ